MSKEIVKLDDTHPLDIISIDKEVLTNMQSFQQRYLHQEPSVKEVQKNKHANDSEYLPISFMEMTLDEIFFGLWQTKNFQTQGIANEIVGSIELWYFHPVAKTWLCRTGAAAVQVQMKSEEKGGDGDITNIRNKITNTLTKDYPHLKADCFRNACLSLGKTFGRDLNRKFDDQYSPVIKVTKQDDIKTRKKLLIELIDKLGSEKKKIHQEILLRKEKDGELDLNAINEMIMQLGGK